MRKPSGAKSQHVAFIFWVLLVPLLLMTASAYYWTALFPRIPLRSAATTQPVEVGQQFEVLGAIFALGELTQKEKDGLARIVRAHLSEPELHLLFWNALSGHGKEKTKPLVERYDMLQNYGGFNEQQFKEMYDSRASKRDAKGKCV